jgi:hypothetical protein
VSISVQVLEQLLASVWEFLVAVNMSKDGPQDGLDAVAPSQIFLVFI